MLRTIGCNQEPRSAVMRPKLSRPPTSLVLASLMILGTLAVTSAQLTGPEPGDEDPAGPPASYITLRGDDLAIGEYATGNINQISTYGLDGNGQFPDPLTSLTSGPGVLGLGNSVSSSGRILGLNNEDNTQNNDQVVNVGRSPDGASAEVSFPIGGAYDLPNLHTPIANTPDLISVAVGDLDKIGDENGANHDEVAVAYGQGSGAEKTYPISLAVLNYTSTQASGSAPLFVTQVQTPVQVSSASSTGSISDLLSLAVGDLDGDGQNEIALATLGAPGTGQVNLTIYRYVHPLLTDTPTLVQAFNHTFTFNVQGGANFLRTISLMAGDFKGTGHNAELILALENEVNIGGGTLQIQKFLQPISFDANLNPTLATPLTENAYTASSQLTLTAGRIIGLPTFFLYFPTKGYDLYRRQIAIINNEQQPIINDSNATLDVEYFSVGTDLSLNHSFANGPAVQLPDSGTGAKFDATTGGLTSTSDINTPQWSLAISQLTSGNLFQAVRVITAAQNPDGSSSSPSVVSKLGVPSSCCTGGSLATDNNFRPTVQATDYRGRTVFLGSPVRLTVNNLINTDFVLEEPPKHALWCESATQPGCLTTPQQLVVVSRVPTINASLTNTSGVSFSGKSTDTSADSIGGSTAISAKESSTANAGIAKVTTTVEATEKASYNYDTNQSSYNSNYASRTLSETESTDNDDFVSGRAQVLDIWRYRVLGISAEDQDGNPINAYYDLTLPGPIVNFKASGLDLDWYQPSYENGNVLSYPPPSNNTFNPPDIGSYGIPCPSGATNCNSDGTQTVTGAMIPATAEFISNTSGTIGLDYSNNTGSGNTVSYSHKLSTSTDVKVSYSASVKILGSSGSSEGSIALNLSTSNSWGNTTTSDSTTTSTTGIKIARSAISSAQAYEFFPTVYTTLDGTIKVAHAVDPLASSAGAPFWSQLYGGLPDPALNLPLRFVRTTSPSGAATWIPNTLSSRKQMRGFFLLNPTPDPVTGATDILNQAPVDGDQVLLSAQVSNYSTAKSFSNCLVQFYAIKYDSDDDTEIGQRQLIGSTTISLPSRGQGAAQILWNTKGFGPAAGGQDYRIYVDLNSGDNSFSEIYPPEDPTKLYAPGLPIGIDPGQNDEGWGLATVMAPASAQLSGVPQQDEFYFASKPLAVYRSGKFFTNNVAAQAGAPLELRADVCAHGYSRDRADVLIFDGPPANGNLIAWKQLYVTNPQVCEGTWFSWNPSPGQHEVEAELLPDDQPPEFPDDFQIPTLEALPETEIEVSAQ